MSVSERYLEDYRALRHGAGAVVTGRDVLEVRGDDAASFLQGQLSQDVAALAPGDVVLSLLLQPDGKLQCLLRVSRAGPDWFVFDLAAGAGEAALARLERFKLRIAADLELRRLSMLAVRGPAAPSMPVLGADSPEPGATGDSHIGSGDVSAPVVAAPVRWGSLPGWDLVAREVAPPPGVLLCDPGALEAIRIESGVPAAGHELTEGLIPAEAGIVPETVSFTKGCFVGQELVARIDSRGGNTPRRLRGVVLEDAEVPPTGAPLVDAGGRALGRITSSAYSPTFGTAVALAYVHRRAEPPVPALVGDDDGRTCEIRPLPLIP